MRSPVCLHAIAFLILQGCCGSDLEYFEEVVRDDHHGTIEGPVLQQIRDAHPDDDDRCDAACDQLLDDADEAGGEVISCHASAFSGVNPWDPENTRVTISCTTEGTERVGRPPTCGRRPHGHRSPTASIATKGDWFAQVAHLERASVIAFHQLAAALTEHAAPPTLVTRCLAAAADELVHTRMIESLAHREGARIPPVVTDAPRTSLFAIALHNATEGCVNEAFAAILAGHQARVAPSNLRSTFARIATDECGHGQLSWDVHAWLIEQLTPRERTAVDAALRHALAQLPSLAAQQAAQTPAELGWPTPTRAAAMAQRFVAMVASA